MIIHLCLVGCDTFVISFWSLTQEDTVLNILALNSMNLVKPFACSLLNMYTIKCNSKQMFYDKEENLFAGVPFGKKCLSERRHSE